MNQNIRDGIRQIFNYFKNNFSQEGLPTTSFTTKESKYLPQYTPDEIGKELELMEKENLISFKNTNSVKTKLIVLTPQGRKDFMGW